jgi:hypothetical protein
MVSKAFKIRKDCPFCESSNTNLIYKKSFEDKNIRTFLKKHLDNNFPLFILKKKYFDVMECSNCSGIFQKNILTEHYNKKFYEDYVPHEESLIKKEIQKNILERKYEQENIYIKKSFNNAKKIKVLEIGAGWGFWSIFAQKNGLDVTAVEISATRRKYLIKNKIKVHKSIHTINDKFHFIFSDQTFEHLSEPLKMLKDSSKLLLKKGVIFLKVPPGIYIKKKLNSNYVPSNDELIPLEHINVFNRKVNKKMAAKCNLLYIYPKNIYPLFTIEYLRKFIVNFYEYFSSKTIIFKK